MAARGVKRPKNRKTKVLLVFDENERRGYLTGFSKRKKERKKIAKKLLESRIKEEKKIIKNQKLGMLKILVKEHKIVPEIEHLVNPEIFDLPDHTVTVTDVSEVDISGADGLRLGMNKSLVDGGSDTKDKTPDCQGRSQKEQLLHQRMNKVSQLEIKLAKQQPKHRYRRPSKREKKKLTVRKSKKRFRK